MSACCDAAGDRKTPSWVRRVREILAWLLPSAILVLVPKCAACLAAQATLWTGLGLSFSTATYLRWSLLLVCTTYSAYARGLDGLWGMYQWLDRAAKGRNESTGPWWRRRGEYNSLPQATASCCH
jgi:hypothetical protein